jgi:hypothetical protein
MGRSEQKQVNREATGLFNTETGNAAQAQNLLMPAYSKLLANPGYTPAQQNAITRSTEGGLGAAFGAEEEGASNRAARMNNTAGLTSTEDALARDRMRTSAAAGAQNETNFANAARTDRNVALGGLGGMFGTNLSGANQTLGVQAGNAKTKGFWDSFADSLAHGAGSTLGAAAFA